MLSIQNIDVANNEKNPTFGGCSLAEEQFGFRKGRGTLQAVQCLQNDIEAASQGQGTLNATFADLSKAFDTYRDIIIAKLENLIDNQSHLYGPIKTILSENYIEIDNGIIRSRPIKQSLGIL